MLIYKKTSTLAVRHLFDPEVMGTVTEAAVKHGVQVAGRVVEETAGKVGGDLARRLAERLRGHLTDHSEKLTSVLVHANDKAWKTIEIALGGDRFWDRFASAEDHGLRDQVKAFLSTSVQTDDPGYLTACLKELRQAREKGHLQADTAFRPVSLAAEVGPFARFDDPESLLAAECTAIEEIAREFQRLGYRHLGRLLAVTPTRGQPLLAMAAQYYFRRAVSEDPVLARELNWVKLTAIDRRVQDGFAFLALIQERHGQALEEALDGLARVEAVVVETHDAVLNLHDDVRGLTEQFKLMRRELTSGHSLSYRDEHERALIEEVKQRYRALSDGQRRRFPQLGLDLSHLEIVAGDYGEALGDAREAARHLEQEPATKAKAHHAGYRAALELKSWDEALAELRQAAEVDPRYAIWPSGRYEIERILGAGAFGVAFLCRDTYLDRLVVIKTFEAAGLDRDVATLFREARILDSLKSPGIIHLYGCGFVDEVRKERPYLELAHFADSLTLEEHVRRNGPLTLDDLQSVALQTAEALQSAHAAGVWHRDVKPANLLVRETARGWEVKVIDFGLSLRRSLVQTTQARAAGQGRSMIGSTIAGTLHYAAPEQLDANRTREIGPHSDVFGFGRTCYFSLFGEPYPDHDDIETLPPTWKQFLGRCTAKIIDRRPKDFAAVLAGLAELRQSGSKVTPPPPPPPPSPHFTNSLGMKMVSIEPGEFLMGSTKGQIDLLVKQFPDTRKEWFDDEQPQHPVKITRPFYLGAHQVTVGQFRRFVDGSGYKTEAEKDGKGSSGLVGTEWKQDASIHWRNPGFPQDDNHPVVCVSHNDAIAFITWLNEQKKGQKITYRLPTEAEWEYAARAGTAGLYGASDDPESLVRIGNVADASLKKILPDANSIRGTDPTCIKGDDGFVYTAPVGSFEPNAWQLCDMIGNVWEWCDDWFDPDFYKTAPRENPHNVVKAKYRVMRGGGWIFNPSRCRPASRTGCYPMWRVAYQWGIDVNRRGGTVGFRVAADQS
jgi:formylglycine-generating enzyme required for sulfatase activity/tRNA A-37 threonylcarbamoyl transferase component Bud32